MDNRQVADVAKTFIEGIISAYNREIGGQINAPVLAVEVKTLEQLCYEAVGSLLDRLLHDPENGILTFDFRKAVRCAWKENGQGNGMAAASAAGPGSDAGDVTGPGPELDFGSEGGSSAGGDGDDSEGVTPVVRRRKRK